MKHFLLFIYLLPLCLLAQTFKGESVEYDAVGNRYLTSDDGTSIVQRASNGTISYFGQGLLAGYGMEIVNNKLFALSGTKIYVYDLVSATQITAIDIAGASFLNGLASDSTRLWVTDFNNKTISEIDISNLASPVVTTIVAAYVSKPNGIVYDKANHRLVVVSWGANAPIKAVDLSNNNALITLTTTALTNIDGIAMDGQGNFYIAAWSPDKIVKYNNDFSQSVDITVAGLNNPADICYALATDTLAIPNTGGNNILFVGFQSPNSLANQSHIGLSFSISPNPMTEKSLIQFEAKTPSSGSYRICDIKGQTLYTQVEIPVKAGKNEIAFPKLSLAKGFYYVKLTIEGRESVQKVFVE